MKLQDAQDVFDGKKYFSDIPQMTKEEDLLFSMGVCIDEHGDIICLTCHLPNECCNCEERK